MKSCWLVMGLEAGTNNGGALLTVHQCERSQALLMARLMETISSEHDFGIMPEPDCNVCTRYDNGTNITVEMLRKPS